MNIVLQKKSILSLMLVTLFFCNIKPVVEEQAKKEALTKGLAYGGLTTIAVSLGLYNFLPGVHVQTEKKEEIFYSVATGLLLGTLVGLTKYFFVMDSRPSVKSVDANKLIDETINKFFLQIDSNLDLNEDLMSKVMKYYGNYEYPLALLARDLDYSISLLELKINGIQKSEKDFLNSGKKEEYKKLIIDLEKLKNSLSVYLSKVKEDKLFNLQNSVYNRDLTINSKVTAIGVLFSIIFYNSVVIDPKIREIKSDVNINNMKLVSLNYKIDECRSKLLQKEPFPKKRGTLDQIKIDPLPIY